MSNNLQIEPLLVENKSRFTVFPIKYPDIWDLYKTSLANFWTVHEIDFSKDEFDNLTHDEQHFIKHVLAFFAASDGIVNENLVVNFYNEIQIPEARQLYAVQILIEAIHSECYSLMIDTYIKDADEKHKLFNAIETIPAINKKANWALKWLSSNNSFSERLLAFTAVEGIFFSGSFCAIFWLKTKNVMNGLTLSNEWISRDEHLHCLTAITLYKHLINKLDKKVIHDIFREAVNIEKEFITESLPVSLIGMNCKLMIQYIEFICDYYLNLLGVDKIYNSSNPFPFMEYISLEIKSNFFEKRVSSYSKVKDTMQTGDLEVDMDF